MNNTELIRPPVAPASEHRTFGDVLAETIPLVGAIAGYGPPVIVLAGPWLLLALVLAGPFAFLLVLVAAMLVAATVVVALAAAVIGAPYLLVRSIRSHRTQRMFDTQLVTVRSPRVAA